MISDETSRGIVRKQYLNSIRKELFRKSIHICSAFIPTLLGYAYIPVQVFLLLALVLYTVSELLRMSGIEVPVIARVTEIAARKRDENKFVLGPVTLVLGIVLTAFLWRPEAARIGIYALAFGDGLASLGGKLFGRIHIPFTNGKTAAGSITCFTAVFCSSFSVCGNARTALVLACTAMIVEVLPLGDYDNIIIPVLTGGLAQLLLP
jgi:dolichol kinase